MSVLIALLVLGALAYCLPLAVAYARGVTHKEHIWLISICFGYTVIGWLVALWWAATDETDEAVLS